MLLLVATGGINDSGIEPLKPASVTVIVVEPTATSVTVPEAPELAFIVPMAVFEEDQIAPELTFCEAPFE